MSRSNSKELKPIFVILAFLGPIILQGLIFYYQVSRDILTIWNFISTLMIVLIFGNAIRMMFSSKKKEEAIQEVQGESTVEMTGPERNTKTTIIQAIIAVVAIALSVVFFRVYNNKTEGLEVVTAEVVSQWGEKKVEVEYDDDGSRIETETEYIEVLIKYQHDGVWRTETLSSGTTSKIYVDELKIYVDNTGKCVSDYGRIEAWKYEAIVFLIFGIIMALTAIFVLGAGFVVGDAIFSIGLALFFLIGAPFIENILYNDIICFIAVFVNIGLYMLLHGVLTLILVGRKGLAGAVTTTTTYVDKLPDPEEEIDEESTFNPDAEPYVPEMGENPVQASSPKFCQYCGNQIAEGSKFCDMCGANLTQDGE